MCRGALDVLRVCAQTEAAASAAALAEKEARLDTTLVVQKYIERPLLLQGYCPLTSEGFPCQSVLLLTSCSFIGRRKFDIRQWVLVTSLNPLRVL